MDTDELISLIEEDGYDSETISEVLHQVAITHMVFMVDEDGHTDLVSNYQITEEQAKVAQRIAMVVKGPSFMLLWFLFVESLLCRLRESANSLLKKILS